MKNILKNKNILLIIFWILCLVGALFTMPNISKVVEEKGIITFDNNLSSQIAKKINKENQQGEEVTQIILVFNDDEKITDNKLLKINSKIDYLKNNKEEFGVTKISDYREADDLKENFISDDNTTLLSIIDIKNDTNFKNNYKKIENEIRNSEVNAYVTGSEVMTKEFMSITEEGIKKTEIISFVFILIVLLFIFRTPIIPFISLATVGISLIISLNIVMNLAKYFDFPLTNFTQAFLIVILFGIGTDYNILLYSNFKENISIFNKQDSISKTFKSAGKTILYSGLAVFIGFSVLGFANFSLYKAASGVAIGILVLLFNLITLNYALMDIFGEKLFWPSKKNMGHSENKLWKSLSKTTISKPFIMLVLMIITFIPVLILGNITLNYNEADEIPNHNNSKKGYNLIKEKFSEGMVAPATLYIKSKENLNTKENLALIDEITEYIKSEKGVNKVLSVTQPTGKNIEQLYLKNQINILTDGINTAQNGINEINKGLEDANNYIKNSDINSKTSNINLLAEGSNNLNIGAENFNIGLKEYIKGVNSYTQEVEKTSNSIMSDNLEKELEELNAIDENINNIKQYSDEIYLGLSYLKELIENIESENYNKNIVYNDIDFIQKYIIKIKELENKKELLQIEFDNYKKRKENLRYYNNLIRTSGEKLNDGSNELKLGINSLNDGVQQLNSEVNDMSEKIIELNTGLEEANNGLTNIDLGISDANEYLNELKNSYIGNKFYIPNNVLASDELKDSYKNYLSNDYKTTSIIIILDDNPTSKESTELINKINNVINYKLLNTSLEKSEIAIGGQSSQIYDLTKVANKDFSRTVIIMLIGISLMLIFVTKSIIHTLTIIFTLLLSYFAASKGALILTKLLLKVEMLSWNTQFFIFIMIVALGVDYSIFLMIKYREELENSKNKLKSIVKSSSLIGGVVISAAFILSGTFAALIPSQVMTLIQVSLGVIVGLLVLTLILPISLSLAIKLENYKK